MTQENKQGDKPQYTGDGVAVWINTDKNGKQYLSIKLAGHNTVNAFKYVPKETQEPVL